MSFGQTRSHRPSVEHPQPSPSTHRRSGARAARHKAPQSRRRVALRASTHHRGVAKTCTGGSQRGRLLGSLKQLVFGSGKRGALLARSRLKRQSSMSRRRTRRAREGGSVGRRTPDASAAAHGSADSPPSWFLLKPRPRFPPRRHASAEERHACAWARRPARGVTHPATQWPRQSLEPPAAAVAGRSPRGRGSLRKPSGQR